MSLSDNLLTENEDDGEVPSILNDITTMPGVQVKVTTEKPATPRANAAVPPRKLSAQHGGQPSNEEIRSMMLGAMGMIVVALTVAMGIMWGFFSFVASWSSHTVATLLTLLLAGGITYVYSEADLPLTSITGPAANSKPFRTFKAPPHLSNAHIAPVTRARSLEAPF